MLLNSISTNDSIETLNDNEILDQNDSRNQKIEIIGNLKELECKTSELFSRTYQYLDIERRHEVEIALKDVGKIYLQTLKVQSLLTI